MIDELTRSPTSTGQPTGFPTADGALGEQLSQAGQERAANAANRANEGWTDDALAIIQEAARDHEFIFRDDVLDLAERRDLPEPPDRRAWGGVWSKAVREGFIEKTVMRRKTNFAHAHRADKPVYRSLIWDGVELRDSTRPA